jgi:PAS domain S-box-containing protein
MGARSHLDPSGMVQVENPALEERDSDRITQLTAGQLLQALPAAVYTTDRDGRITFYNRAAAALWGREPVLGESVWCGSWRLYWPDGRPMRHDECPMAVALKEGRSIPGEEAVAERPDGTRVPFLAYPTPLFDEAGRLSGAINTLIDISGRKRAEDITLRQTRRLEALNRIAKSIADDLDLTRIVQTVTDSATELIGARFGAFFYNVTDDSGEAYRLFTLSGAPREAFEKFGMPRSTAVFGPTFHGQGVVRSDDIRKDPRYGKSAPYYGMPQGHLPVVSYLAVPVVSRSGEVHGGLFFAHDQPARRSLRMRPSRSTMHDCSIPRRPRSRRERKPSARNAISRRSSNPRAMPSSARI